MRFERFAANAAMYALLALGGAAPLLACAEAASAADAPKTSRVDAALLVSERIEVKGALVVGRRIVDRAGEHLLVVSLLAGPSSAPRATPGATERVDLFAALYTRKDASWPQAWIIQDKVDCPGLDSSAQFFSEHITVTDLDKNGIAEVTVPYKMSCGGGIDANTLKVILRQGAQKLALRGTTLRNAKMDAHYGGEMSFDPTLLLKENAVFKTHLKFIRDKVYVED
ncbi:hypothetical protein F2P45_01835 [Massilia sp. CCM 8733]|uniref:Lipoprotein n=1 Tax=Massilia mucilaginosa TaxID=2609282 RepID=A0ABX0NLW5_9BURK|nr:hypothetical protein [Massilia mucilaginosa]NHZ87778.1 hypothetical protein [Massilia mucilaginosa]